MRAPPALWLALLVGCTPKESPPADSGARPEPVTVDLEGWVPTDSSSGRPDRQAHARSELKDPAGACRVILDRWWGVPDTPGGAMTVASSRKVTVDGRELELVTTEIFQGHQDKVDLLFVDGKGFQVRITFRDCPATTVDRALTKVHLHAPPGG